MTGSKTIRFALIIGVLLMIHGRTLSSQDPAIVNAKTIHVKLDNNRVRVLEAVLNPGDKEQLHSHPAYVIYVVAGGKTRNHTVDGKTNEQTLNTGDVI